MEKIRKKREKKPDYDRLSETVQVPLKPMELKILERLRRESTYTTNAAYVRALIKEHTKKKNQTELI